MDKISIIVPVYNMAEYLPQCLDSLINQSYPNLEVICVNDGSTDKSADILTEYQKKSDKVLVLSQKNRGVSVARNKGLEIASGEWIMFVDSDDWIDRETINVMFETAVARHSQIVMCSYVKEYHEHSEIIHILNNQLTDKYQQNVQLFHRRLFGPVREEMDNPRNLDIMVTPVMQLFKRETIKNERFYDISDIGSFEDGLFQIGVYRRCDSFTYIDRPFYHYRKTNAASITTRYNADLAKQHEHLYGLMKSIIQNENYGSDYLEALNNRVCCDLVGLAINEARAPLRVSEKSYRMGRILSSQIYIEALRKLRMTHLPIKWQLVFWAFRSKRTFIMMLLLTLFMSLRNKTLCTIYNQ